MNYYEVLNISQSANSDDIKRAYHKLARINHPDKNGKKEDFQKIDVKSHLRLQLQAGNLK